MKKIKRPSAYSHLFNAQKNEEKVYALAKNMHEKHAIYEKLSIEKEISNPYKIKKEKKERFHYNHLRSRRKTQALLKKKFFTKSCFQSMKKLSAALSENAILPFNFNILPFSGTRIKYLLELLKNPELSQIIIYMLAMGKQLIPLSFCLQQNIILPEELAEIALIGEGSASETILSVLRKNKYFELATKISNKVRDKQRKISAKQIKTHGVRPSSFFPKKNTAAPSKIENKETSFTKNHLPLGKY